MIGFWKMSIRYVEECQYLQDSEVDRRQILPKVLCHGDEDSWHHAQNGCSCYSSSSRDEIDLNDADIFLNTSACCFLGCLLGNVAFGLVYLPAILPSFSKHILRTQFAEVTRYNWL